MSAAAVATTYTNNASTSGVVAVGGSTTGTLTTIGEHDWLKVSLQAGQAYAISLNAGGLPEQLEVGTAAALDEGSFAVSASLSGVYGRPGFPDTAFFRPDATGDYYIDVSAAFSTATPYTVSVATVTTAYTNNTGTSGAVTVGGSTVGALRTSGEHDWLKISLLAGQAYVFTLSGGSSGQQLKVGTATNLDEGILTVGGNTHYDTPGTAGQPVSAFFRPDAAGTYYIDVSDTGATGSYSVSAAAVTTAYANNTSTSGAVAIGGRATGTLTVNNEHDWLKVSLQAEQAYVVTLSGGTGYNQLKVGTAASLDEGSFVLGSGPYSFLPGASPGLTVSAFFRPATTGTYYIDVSEVGGAGSTYTVSVATASAIYTNNTSTSGAVAIGGITPPSPDPLLDAAYYLVHNPDVAAAGVDPYMHYMAHGWQEGRNPDAWFDTNYYLAQNPDVKAAGVNPLAQFEAYGWKEGRDPSLAFSDSKYLAANPDVAAAQIDPLAHFLTHSQAEGRMAFLSGGTAPADPLVNAAYYDPQLGATIIPAGAAAAQQVAFSYDAAGWQRHLNPDALFDTGYYLAHNPDVAAAHIDPLAHYEAHGWKEGRDPSAAFSTSRYLAANPDVAAARIDPLLHYVANGQAEGRTAFHV